MAKKDRWLIGLVTGAVVTGAALFVAYSTTEQRRQQAVERFNVKAAVLKAKIPSLALPPMPDKKQSVHTPAQDQEGEDPNPGDARAESVTAYTVLFAKKKALDEDPQWKDAVEAVDKPLEEQTDADRKKIAAYLDACRGLILELRRLAEAGGPAYALDWSKGWAMELPHLAPMRVGARLLAADAAVKARDGSLSEAVEDVAAITKLGNSLHNEPILISQLVRIAMASIGYAAVERNIQGEDLTPEQYRVLANAMANPGGREAFANSFTGEGMFGLSAFDSIRNGTFDAMGVRQNNGRERFLYNLYGSAVARPWLNMDQEAYTEIISRVGDAVALPYYESRPLLDQIEADVNNLPFTRVMSRILLPALARAAEAEARIEAQSDLLRLGLAVEQYHGQTGRYPADLQEVRGILGADLPVDPFTGQSFVYHPGADSFELYAQMSLASTLPGFTDENGNLSWRHHKEDKS